jgi:hypothetical protein
MHAACGGANSDTLSGTSSARVELWGSKLNLGLLVRCLCFMAQEVAISMERVIGIQMVNEDRWNSPGMYIFYENALPKIGAIDPTLPVYISDGWGPRRALICARSKNSVKGKATNPVIVDTHVYYTFAEKTLLAHRRSLSLKSP